MKVPMQRPLLVFNWYYTHRQNQELFLHLAFGILSAIHFSNIQILLLFFCTLAAVLQLLHGFGGLDAFAHAILHLPASPF